MPLSIAMFLISLQASAFQVLIDPGHGGHDRGATAGKIAESEITLQIASLVAEDLKSNPQIKVSLTRTKDVFLTLEDRARLANKGANLFLSIHVNASSDKRARGNELYFQNQLPPDEDSLFLANLENQGAREVSLQYRDKNLSPDVGAIIEDLERSHRLRLSGLLAEELHRNWGGDVIHRQRSIRQAPFFVISNVNVPAALIEVGYLTNEIEGKKLTTASYQSRIAKGISRAVIRFKEVMDNKVRPVLN